MESLRTPDERFVDLPDYPFEPNYVEVDGLRWHYIDEGNPEDPPILLLHGEPSWSYLYRHMIPILVAAGMRAIAPDLIGFGKSDKPAEEADYTYQRHVDWTWAWMETVILDNVTMVCQDWGSLIGLRLVAEHPDRFARVILANGGLPTGAFEMPPAFMEWQAFSRNTPILNIGQIIQGGTSEYLPDEVIAAYDAPFPDDSYKAGARIFPSLVPTSPNDPAAPANRAAWKALRKYEKPFLTAFSDGDPVTRGGDKIFQRLVRGAKGQQHTTINGAGHFLQEDGAPELARVTLDFIKHTSQEN